MDTPTADGDDDWQRVCFRLQVAPDRLDAYRAHHAAVWPEMLEALEACGWHNYSLFLDDDGTLIGYFETPSLEAALDGMSKRPVNQRWQELMAPFFVSIDGPADQHLTPLAEVFNLESQLTHVRTHYDQHNPDNRRNDGIQH